MDYPSTVAMSEEKLLGIRHEGIYFPREMALQPPQDERSGTFRVRE